MQNDEMNTPKWTLKGFQQDIRVKQLQAESFNAYVAIVLVVT